MAIIQSRKQVTVVSYVRTFDYEGSEGSGFAFDCDANGKVFVETLRPTGRANYEACLTGQVGSRKMVDRGVEKREHSYFEPAVCRCDCGARVVLHSSWANDCHCGREYNASGQLLAPRSQWGEETGEQF